MGLGEAFTCVEVGAMLPSVSGLDGDQPGGREDPSRRGHHRLDFSQGGGTGNVPFGAAGLPCEETCRCSSPLAHLRTS